MALMDITSIVQARALAAGIETITGQRPEIVPLNDGRARLTFNPEQRAALRTFLLNNLNKQSAVEIDLLPVVLPWAAILASGLLLTGLAAGFLFRR